MIWTDVPVFVLIFLDVYVGFQDQQFFKNKQKIADFAPLKSKKPILVHWYCVETFLVSLLRSCMTETDLPRCVLIFLDVYVDFQDQQFVKSKQKIADLAP